MNWFGFTFWKARDSLDLLGISLEDVCSHIFAIGGTGSGKTSVLKILLRDILRRGGPNIGCLWCCVKPDEAANACRVIELAGAQDRLLILVPGEFTYNFLSFELTRQNGSPTTATQLLQDLNNQLSQSKGEHQDSFWANLYAMLLTCCITIAWLSKREKVTIEDVYRVMLSLPAAFAQVASTEFQSSSYAFQLLQLAENGIRNAGEMRQYKQSASFLLSEFIQIGSKARGAAISEGSAVLVPFLNSPMYETVCAEHSTFSPEMALDGACVVLAAPIMSHGPAGMLLQSIVTTQLSEAALRRLNPQTTTIVVRDELQMLINNPAKEAMIQSVSRSQRLAFVSGCQSLPTLQSAMGGNQAEQELHSVFANYSTKLILSNHCARTNDYFSQSWGQHREDFVSVSETKEEEKFDLLNFLMGNDRFLFSVSEQMAPRCPPERFLSLRRGGPHNKLLVDFFLSQAGRTYGPQGDPFTLKTLRQI
ncbi:hypothetical protein DTL42_16090 [Bremerella cremea]|uniref:TraD/TraG TraM recognition site domain-containing protein n=1 Tax=Bremerella cremea TaxID=1031537 RepID=A0A368KT48_9BACT|nr:TraM recognition domain-containing protein [Bremerella cremea]RCS46476.1 hypothetical protein DTL42_16090 [Bremerella cremea]